jgi:hypothetical protein
VKPQRHLVIFVKAPRIGAVKTRLAADIGALAAWRFYRETTARVVRRLGGDPRWTCWLAVTPDRFARRGRFWPRRLARLAQGPGDLGARMARQIARLPPGPVVIVGTDVPDITAAHVARAFGALERCAAVFGPAPDGGYWLIGVDRRRPTAGLFRDVRWSSRHALADTLANLPPGLAPEMLDELADIDDGDGYRRWRLTAGPTFRADRAVRGAVSASVYKRRPAATIHTTSPAETTPAARETQRGSDASPMTISVLSKTRTQ